ncbi:phosphatase PAP2 family protein [Thermogemmatispora sp.]|uniref:phosphatase PAP2 family protein n=1 Tax=Thermogemmatispora sp. TaxID=1968838 RepID=UPI001D692E47|nr:phosphatase PAP2 family protein [Thermogemmatispora sp.]MBX5449096.1 phosphoesterase PA-phosphatase [Thermogemmatispora sp.]
MNSRRLSQVLKEYAAGPQLGECGMTDSESLRLRIARYVSTVLAPFSISLPLVMSVALYHSPDPGRALACALIALFFLSLGPLLYIVIGVHTGRLSDLDITRRTERLGPYLFSISSATVGLFVLQALHGPYNLMTLLIITIISGIVMLFITLWWKISVHASSMASAATLLTAMYGSAMLPLFLLLILVSWSRVVLRRHTVAQVTIGALLSILLTTLILKLRGV